MTISSGAAIGAPPKPYTAAAELYVFGVRLANFSESDALGWLNGRLTAPSPTSVYIVNAHTLNLACAEPAYHALLNRADAVFGDGTGVRWASRLRGRPVKANLVGTDLMPSLFAATAGRGLRYFLLGADETSIERAAEHCRRAFPGWELAGYHHGYVDDPAVDAAAVAAINAARPHLLLVGMGNPRQERWIDAHLAQLDAGVCVGVGGLFDHWAGNIQRAPRWVRRLGYEWLQLLQQQPHKWRRYLFGNPLFIARMLSRRRADIDRNARAVSAQ